MLINSVVQPSTKQPVQGFSLLELMLVLLVISVLASFAVPIYERYIMRAAQERAEGALIDNQRRLEMFKQKNVTYAGFTFNSYYSAGNFTSTSVNVPINKTDAIRQYQILLGDTATGAALNTVDTMASPGWRMVAVPNRSLKSLSLAPYLLMDSNGLRCSTSEVLTIQSATCGNNGLTW